MFCNQSTKGRKGGETMFNAAATDDEAENKELMNDIFSNINSKDYPEEYPNDRRDQTAETWNRIKEKGCDFKRRAAFTIAALGSDRRFQKNFYRSVIDEAKKIIFDPHHCFCF